MSSSESPAFLVTLPTGKQGGSVARELLSAGYRVHALVRDASKPEAKALEALGAILFVGDLTNVDVINKAAVGVKGIFINPFPDFTDPSGEAKAVQRFVDAARATGTVDTLVLSTSLMVANHKKYLAEEPDYKSYPVSAYYASKDAAEDALRASGAKYWTILRPPWLFHNYTAPASLYHWPQLHTERILTTAMSPDLPIVHWDGEDIGRWAKAIFLDPAKFTGKEIKLGAETYTLPQIVRGLEEFADVKITTNFLEPSEIAKDTSDPMAQMRALTANFINAHPLDLTPAEYEIVRSYGIPITKFPEWLEKNKKAIFETLKVPL